MSFFKKWLTEYRPKPTLFCFLFFTDTTASRPLVRLTVVRLLSVTVASDCCPLRWVAPVPSHRTKTGFCETPPPPAACPRAARNARSPGNVPPAALNSCRPAGGQLSLGAPGARDRRRGAVRPARE